MEDYSERNLHIIEEAMQELGISDCEEIPEAIRLLKQQRRPTRGAVDGLWDCANCDNRQIGSGFAECPNCGTARH